MSDRDDQAVGEPHLWWHLIHDHRIGLTHLHGSPELMHRVAHGVDFLADHSHAATAPSSPGAPTPVEPVCAVTETPASVASDEGAPAADPWALLTRVDHDRLAEASGHGPSGPGFANLLHFVGGLVAAARADERERITASGADLIAAERRRQVEVEGYTADHDAEHGSWALLQAGLAYELDGATGHLPGAVPTRWPWTRESWKPRDPISNLIRAGALYLAAADLGRDTAKEVERCARLIDAARATLAQPADDAEAGR